MAGPDSAAARAWTRRVPGSSLSAFFGLTILLTYLAVYTWNVRAYTMTGILTALASALPILLVYVASVARPVWAFRTSARSEDIERAVRQAVRGPPPQPSTPRGGIFRACPRVLRVFEPRCTVGWRPAADHVGAAGPTVLTTILLLGESRDREGLARLRQDIADALEAPPPNRSSNHA